MEGCHQPVAPVGALKTGWKRRVSRVEQIYTLRTEAGLTQEQLATLIGTKGSSIARLESADYEGHSLSMLRRIAEALDMRIEVHFIPREKMAV
jgi:transcriptional regulator with XRE-family HTH domain